MQFHVFRSSNDQSRACRQAVMSLLRYVLSNSRHRLGALDLCSMLRLFIPALIFTSPNLCLPSWAADRDAIWKVVHDQCVPNFQKFNEPSPCVEVHPGAEINDGFAILKDLKGTAHFLMIPTDRLAGIESPELLQPSAVNWFDLAWRARGLLSQTTHHYIADDDVALAINSVEGRGQDQFHIHISCISPQIKAEISEQERHIPDHWSQQSINLDGKLYYATRERYKSASAFNPIKMVADGISGARMEMGRMSVMVVGMGNKNEGTDFFVFAGRSDKDRGDRGKAEDFLDNSCSSKPLHAPN